MTGEAEVLIIRNGAAGVITLNRPKALNALTHRMVRAIHAALLEWEADPAIRTVLVKAAGDRAFCAGGDIRELYDFAQQGRVAESLVFWREEYILNRYIKRYPKPYVALINGIVMGGGVGVSQHGSHRVAGEKYAFAMPEVSIGLFPDVGGTWFLPRLPFHAGRYLALTGQRIGRGDAVALGIATHAVSGASFAAVEAELAEGADVDAVLAAHAALPEPAQLPVHRGTIERCFAGPDLGTILGALAADGTDFATSAAATMRTKCPLSMGITLEQMLRGGALSFEDCMTLEMRIVTRVAHGREFYEGVRAIIVDKDQSPRWQPARIEDLDPEEVLRHFEPLDDDLHFSGKAQ